MNLPHEESRFQDVLQLSRLQGLCVTSYKTVNHDMLVAFVERWNSEISFFHTLISELCITLDDVSCLIHLLIMERLLNHSGISRDESQDLMVNYLEADSGDTQIEMDATGGTIATFYFLERIPPGCNSGDRR